MSGRGEWFITASGRQFWPFDPRWEDVSINDIAHALSMVCRFGGHSQSFYSVAQHSVWVSQIVPEKLALLGLMHDAAEAYVGDVIRPIKRSVPNFCTIEAGVMAAIYEALKIAPPNPAQAEILKRADSIMLVTERRDLVARHAHAWKEDEQGYHPLAKRIRKPLLPRDARDLFLRRWKDLRP